MHAQVSCLVTAQLNIAFVFAIQIVQSLFSFNLEFQASSLLLRLYRPNCWFSHATACLMIAKIIFILPFKEEDQIKEEDCNKIQSLCNRVLPVVQHLRENSHQQLAYLFSVHMLNTLTQYIQQQDMGLPLQSEVICLNFLIKVLLFINYINTCIGIVMGHSFNFVVNTMLKMNHVFF